MSAERYTVSSVTKLAGDLWTINARIQYGSHDVIVPVPMRVLWAEDTPVLTMTDAGIPEMGTFTARVLIYRDQYAGTWSSETGSGGQLFGRLERASQASPMLVNPYMNRLLKGWRITKRGEQFQAHIVNYADDFVILGRAQAAEALNWTRPVATRLGLTRNEAKTSVKQARKESFDFLGSTFGPHRFKKDGHWYFWERVRQRRAWRVSSKRRETFWRPAMSGRGRRCEIG